MIMNLNHILFYVALFSISAEAYDWSETKQQLISGKPKEQQEAMAKFGKGDRTAVPVLIEIVAKEKDSAARARAGQTLIRLMKIPANRTPADIPTLGALVDSEDRAVAGAALGALANFQGDAHAKQYIRRAIAAKRDDFIRAQAVGCLSIVSEHDGSEGEFLKDLLKDKAELVRVRAAYSLGKSNSADGLPVVLEILRRPPGNGQALMIISEAASAAGEIGDPVRASTSGLLR